MTVVLNWKNTEYDWPHPTSPVACSFCGDEVQLPFVYWTCGYGDDICICASCCGSSRRGLVADMMRADAISKGLNPPSDCPTLRAVQ